MRARHSFASLGAIVLLLASVLVQAANYQLVTLAEPLHHPWSVVQLPEGDLLVSERRGRLLRVSPQGDTTKALSGVPDTLVGGQGGFFDVVLHPRFDTNQLIYLAYAKGSPDENATAVWRARLSGDALLDGEDILVVKPAKPTQQHYGGRLLFLPDESLLITTGDAFDRREQAQSLDSELGKVLRVMDDGSTPPDNPFAREGAERIWTLGHRNPQGLALDRATGDVYLHEHGPRGGDEVNLLEAGANYGWPAATGGLDYSGAYVSPFTTLPGMTDPLYTWTPSIAPSGLTIYRGEVYPAWQGRMLIGALVDAEVRMLTLSGGAVVAEEALFTGIGERIRDVYSGRDGLIYLLTDSEEGRLIQVRPTTE